MIHRESYLSKIFILLAVAVMAAGCNQNPPSVGETGTITPVDDSTGSIEPADGMQISYERCDSLLYVFSCRFNRSTETVAHTAQFLWEIVDPGKTEPHHVHRPYSDNIHYMFQAPGKARITATLEDSRDIPLSASITIDVY